MINLKRTTLWTLVGIQVVVFISLYILSWRIALLESTHEEPTEQKD